MTYQNDKLVHMSMEVNAKITDPMIKEAWEEYKKEIMEDNPEFNKEGMVQTFSIDDQNYSYKTTLEIDVEKAKEEDLEEQGISNLKNDNSTIEESKESAEQDGYLCRIE